MGMVSLNAIVIGTFVLGGRFFFNLRKDYSNSYVTNLYSNTRYTLVKDNIIQNFEVLNRSFTEDEIKQFIYNRDLRTKGARKYVFNPYLHETEEQYREEYERLNSGKFQLSEKSKQEIKAQNKAKEEAGEGVVQRGYDPKIIETDSAELGLIQYSPTRPVRIN